MPKFKQLDEILRLMSRKECIRNVGIVAHIDHGKTTMTDSLLAKAGLLPSQMAGSARALDYLEEEQKRGITMKTANISLLHKMNGQGYVINLIDTPGHVDFTGKVTRALRATDSVVVVVDAVEEIMAQTETVVRQALEERVKPVLFINKADRLISELKLGADDIQERLERIILAFNNLVEVFGERDFKDKWKIDPRHGSVVFGSALHKWGFTLGIAKEKQVGFADVIATYAKKDGLTLQRMLPLHKAILDMIIGNGPSPIEAQKYRVPKIWRGSIDSEVGRGMLDCCDSGPTVMCITNAQIDPKNGLIATGRVFSGSVKGGDDVYLVGAAKECHISQVSIYMSSFRETVDKITAGNIAALAGLELARAGEALVDSFHRQQMIPFEDMKYVSEPVITVAVEPRNPMDLPRFDEAVGRLSIEDPNIAVTIDQKTGEYLVSGMGELHLETALKLLADYSNARIVASEPTADYRESISKRGQSVAAGSPDEQSELCVQVEPVEGKRLESIMKSERRDVWAIDRHRNMLVSSIETSQIADEARNMIIAGFHWACRTGPLCEQPLRNINVKLLKAQIHGSSTQHAKTQIARTMSRAIFGSFLTANPMLLEPVFKIEVSSPPQWFGTCANIITRRRGRILHTDNTGFLTKIIGRLPVAETLGLATEIRIATSGHAFWQTIFDHWEKVPNDAMINIIKHIRARRGLPPEIPKPSKFISDRLEKREKQD